MLARETTVSVKSSGISPFRNFEELPHDLRTDIHAHGSFGGLMLTHIVLVRFTMRIQQYTVKPDFVLW